jgi:hypothetical protein
MAQYKIEYRGSPDGEVLRSSFVLARDVAEAETEAEKSGAPHYRIFDRDGAVVAQHGEQA